MSKQKIVLSKKRKEKMMRDSSLKREYEELIANGSMVGATIEMLAEKYKLKPTSVSFIVRGYDKKYGRNNYTY